ncbi:Fe3+-hydroxamate ABC transporter substrate-binding protein [Prauserella sp. PE36]|uniref:ABC transporter substrate-binding protein n=1 Tax=Prauserella sp. PE36 TaxID=1504709 RepID=UPI000DE53AB9|nr:ABC transporter substrate-binding protein [Prauserella sp. PE36]RBM10617.1 Fe3+-hydroxamate ABC transporter substrate-binding protein [Prauserella sp. PE36]
MVSTLSRRSLLGGAAAVAASGLLAACGRGGSAASGSGAWSFTDDTGATVELDARPTTIAGLNDAIASLWNYGITPVGSFGQTGLADDVNFKGKDLSKVTELGTTHGEINLEKLANLAPDLILTHAYPVDSSGKLDPSKPLFGFKDLQQQKLVGEIAPIVALAMKGSAAGVVDRTVEFAKSIGVTDQKLKGPREDYEAARTRLENAATSGLSVMAVAAYQGDGIYIAKAKDDPALRSYTELGVKYPDPGGSEYFWQQVSWENVADHPVDVVLYSLRAMSGEDMLKQPTFAATPAAKAGQVFPWEFSSMDYVAQARTLDNLAENLESSRKVT